MFGYNFCLHLFMFQYATFTDVERPDEKRFWKFGPGKGVLSNIHLLEWPEKYSLITILSQMIWDGSIASTKDSLFWSTNCCKTFSFFMLSNLIDYYGKKNRSVVWCLLYFPCITYRYIYNLRICVIYLCSYCGLICNNTYRVHVHISDIKYVDCLTIACNL